MNGCRFERASLFSVQSLSKGAPPPGMRGSSPSANQKPASSFFPSSPSPPPLLQSISVWKWSIGGVGNSQHWLVQPAAFLSAGCRILGYDQKFLFFLCFRLYTHMVDRTQSTLIFLIAPEACRRVFEMNPSVPPSDIPPAFSFYPHHLSTVWFNEKDIGFKYQREAFPFFFNPEFRSEPESKSPIPSIAAIFQGFISKRNIDSLRITYLLHATWFYFILFFHSPDNCTGHLPLNPPTVPAGCNAFHQALLGLKFLP